MYVTRPLSLYRNFPSARSANSPEAPCSGYLVVTDEEAEAQATFCWGAYKNKRVTELPFPQDKILKVVPSSDSPEPSVTRVWFIPVLDQPLSSNRYYVIRAEGKHTGLACTCSREDDIVGCCFRDAITDVKPIPFNHRDIYQQVEIHRHYKGGFYAKSVAGDGFPPKFLRRKGWQVYTSTSLKLQVRETQGLDTSLPTQLPEFNFPIYYKCSPPVVVARWYCPFVFVKEEAKVEYQVRRCLLYEMTLEQWWEEIYSCENESNESNVVSVNASVQREAVLVYGSEAVKDNGHIDDGFVWFTVHDHQFWRRGVGVGLSSAIVEKMRWVQERRGGCGVGGVEREVRVERVEEIGSGRQWERFGCYVLVESFVLKRMDGLVLLSSKFRHSHRIRSKWE
ncbi:Solute carrier organic anion transporter family member 1B7 like [Actinidia chinensis var. chinensis]|uniref:Solute carrier organic anion transporter family member 1B7 like n=1 Tax=Actinidia chinensis var. chinensis TaxID=1590841 RepID=A0A2R6P9V7_ACTCC|nr:Solute carrier organic anion transporter family member 1B7 like [Actinidia chinensis var. chinensis]